MKFAAVVVLFALAWGVNASVIPVGPISLVQGHAVYSAVPSGSVAIQASAVPVQVIPAVHQIVHTPVAVAPLVHVVPAEGTYVAKTRGAVHVAALPGHAQSASSINLEPAPGTH